MCSVCLVLLISVFVWSSVDVYGGEITNKKHPPFNKTTLIYFPYLKKSPLSTHRAKRATATEFSDEDKELIRTAHNRIRAEVVDASNMVAVEWNADLENEAKRWASLCDFQHPPDKRVVGEFNGIGQNLYLSWSKPTASRAIKSWESEGPDYVHGTFSCTPGEICGHYTQVIWAETTSIGCAMKYCNPMTSAGPITRGYYVVCEYGPSGNRNSADPYKKGTPCSQCPDGYTACVDGLCSSKSSACTPWNQDRFFYSLIVCQVTTALLWFIHRVMGT